MAVQSPAPSPAPGTDSEPPRATPAPWSAKSRVACFSIQAEAEPGVMPRVMELFAKRGLVQIAVFPARSIG